jgi:TPR repeat protein
MERCLQADTLGKHSGDRLLLGEYYYGSKEYRKAEKLLQDVYGKDDPETKPEAAMLLGQIYQYGAGSINADFEKAKNYYLYMLTEQNSSEAAYRMATLYERGAGRIKPDVNTAVTWYEKAADMGNRKAEEELKHFRKGFFGGYSRI